MSTRFPTFYLSHGGGPWPYMSGELRRHHAKLEASLRELPGRLPSRPEAIIVVSAHWEESDYSIMASAAPPMVYDYHGFPEETYRVRYGAAGAPELARRAHALLGEAGLASHLDPVRGFDHGTHALLAIVYPTADIPVIQVSIRADYDPSAHLKLGRSLAALRDEGVLIVGSGSSYHNLQRFFRGEARRQDSAQFDGWLRQTLTDSTPEVRTRQLLQWQHGPAARAAHPQEEHLVPLFVAVGAAEREPGQVVYGQDDFFGAITLSSYQFG